MATAASDTGTNGASTSVTSSLLAIHLLGGTSNSTTGTSVSRSLPTIRLVHDDYVMQQLPINLRSQLVEINLALADFCSARIINW
jgi:transposase-like protein